MEIGIIPMADQVDQAEAVVMVVSVALEMSLQSRLLKVITADPGHLGAVAAVAALVQQVVQQQVVLHPVLEEQVAQEQLQL